MRRESSTVVVLVGQADDRLLAALARSGNISVVRAPGDDAPESALEGQARAGWEQGALAMREAARRRSTYVIVPDDPLHDVADSWQAMWEVPGAQDGAAGFEASAADALGAWRDKRFDLPDYYLVIAPAQPEVSDHGASPGLYLGPLRAVRPRRVAVAAVTDSSAEPSQILNALRLLEHGPWWPPLEELLDAARRFYPGSIDVSQSLIG